MSPKQHGTRPSASMQFENDRNTQRRMMSGYILFTSCRMRWKQQTVSPPTVGDVPVDQSKKRKKKKQSWVGQRHMITPPQIPWPHTPPRCFALLAELIAVCFSSDMQLTLMLLSQNGQSIRTPTRDNNVSTAGTYKVTTPAMELSSPWITSSGGGFSLRSFHWCTRPENPLLLALGYLITFIEHGLH